MAYDCLLCSFIAGVLIHLWDSSSAAPRINVALTGKATQSSVDYAWYPENAIDGNSDPRAEHNSCSGTNNQNKAWWRLELPNVYKVSEIEVTNRDSYRNRLNDVEILIGNSPINNGNDNPRCAIIYDTPGSVTQTVLCRGMEGRFINFHKSCGSNHILLCEVKVYGELVPTPSNSIQGIGRNMTLVQKRLGWSDALLYCRDFHWDLLSIRDAKDQEMIDELVAQASFPLTSHLWLGLRRSIIGSDWFWMSGDPVDLNNWDKGSQHSSPCGTVSSTGSYTWNKRSCDEQLDFICFTGPDEGVNRLHFSTSTRQKQTVCV